MLCLEDVSYCCYSEIRENIKITYVAFVYDGLVANWKSYKILVSTLLVSIRSTAGALIGDTVTEINN